MSIAFDTHRFVKNLQSAGFTIEQAEALAEEIQGADISQLATKDVLKEETATLRTDLANLRAEIYRAMAVQAVGIVGLTVALVKLLP